MKRYAFIILLCVAVSFVMASCGDEVILDNQEMCTLSGGDWKNSTCQCGGTDPCGEGIFCIGEKDNEANLLRCANKSKEEASCTYSGGKWEDSKCQCGEGTDPCGAGIFCIGEKDSLSCANKSK